LVCIGLACDPGVDVPDADAATDDAMPDGASSVDPFDIPWLGAGAPDLGLTPCPSGWYETTDDGIANCTAYPPEGRASCGVGEAHFAGEPSCRPIGDACPVGDFATDLPTDGPLIYVLAGAAAGGDGTLAAPHASLSDVGWSALAPGTTVALGRGSYEGTLPLKPGIRVVGACVEQTILTGVDAPVRAVVSVTGMGEPAELANATISGAPQIGAVADVGSLSLTGVVIDGTAGMGACSNDSRGTLMMADTVIRNVRQDAGGLFGRGVNVQGGRLEATRLVVERAREVGIFLLGVGTSAVVADTTVVDTLARPTGEGGFGMDILAGAEMNASRVVLAGNRDIGLHVSGDGSHMVAEDLVVRDTEPRGNRMGGRGVQVDSGAHFEGTRVVVSRNSLGGFLVAHPGSEADLAGILVRDTRPQPRDLAWGNGLQAQEGAQLRGNGIAILRSRLIGLGVAGEDTIVTVSDVLIRDTQPQESDRLYGLGVGVYLGAVLSVERLVVDRAFEIGALAASNGRLTLTDAVVTGIEPAACDCALGTFGHALAAAGGSISARRFSVHHTAGCGLFVGATLGYPGVPELDAMDGVVEATSIGACIQVDGFDIERVSQNVIYRDNAVNLDTTMLPIPMPPEVM